MSGLAQPLGLALGSAQHIGLGYYISFCKGHGHPLGEALRGSYQDGGSHPGVGRSETSGKELLPTSPSLTQSRPGASSSEAETFFPLYLFRGPGDSHLCLLLARFSGLPLGNHSWQTGGKGKVFLRKKRQKHYLTHDALGQSLWHQREIKF